MVRKTAKFVVEIDYKEFAIGERVRFICNPLPTQYTSWPKDGIFVVEGFTPPLHHLDDDAYVSLKGVVYGVRACQLESVSDKERG